MSVSILVNTRENTCPCNRDVPMCHRCMGTGMLLCNMSNQNFAIRMGPIFRELRLPTPDCYGELTVENTRRMASLIARRIHNGSYNRDDRMGDVLAILNEATRRELGIRWD